MSFGGVKVVVGDEEGSGGGMAFDQLGE